FFSSRRRHTRFSRDWSSDVCSSDLPHIAIDTVVLEQETPSSVPLGNEPVSGPRSYRRVIRPDAITRVGLFTVHKVDDKYYFEIRSEERRVGKEGRGREWLQT